MRKSSQFEYGVLEVKMQCFRGFQPRVHELLNGGIIKWRKYCAIVGFVKNSILHHLIENVLIAEIN